MGVEIRVVVVVVVAGQYEEGLMRLGNDTIRTNWTGTDKFFGWQIFPNTQDNFHFFFSFQRLSFI